MAIKRTILYFNIDPEVRNRYKAVTALQGKSLKEWALDAMREKLERDLPGGGLREALRLARSLHPQIAAGTKGEMDVAQDMRTLRQERPGAIGS